MCGQCTVTPRIRATCFTPSINMFLKNFIVVWILENPMKLPPKTLETCASGFIILLYKVGEQLLG